MKKIAFYLPQFHSIPENDEWWGEGFTEWVNVKKAEPQFKGHCQPEIPLNNNYYDLSDVRVMEKQSQIAKEYGIDGFCYYHYWFEGKLLLEKPLENMLSDPYVDVPFMMCWANESWARTWDGAETELLIKQNYNESIEELKNHFEYMVSFFKDERYIKVNNKPVFIIYKPHLIENIDELIAQWNKWAIEEGFSGIYWGFQHHSAFEKIEKLGQFQFGIEFEPFYTIWSDNIKQSLPEKLRKKLLRIPTIFDYDAVWKKIVQRDIRSIGDIEIMPGAFTSWDNTPRRGNKSIVFFESTPQKFKNYIKMKIENISDEQNVKFLFINAWNEWAEGAHLEPDTINGFGYLDAIKALSNE